MTASNEWDDFDPFAAAEPSTEYSTESSDRSRSTKVSERRRDRSSFGGAKDRRKYDKENFRGSSGRRKDYRAVGQQNKERKINMNALTQAGFIHLYGLAPVLNALRANKRDFSRAEELIDLSELQGEALEHEMAQRSRKPEAQFSTWLFVQDSRTSSSRSSDKLMQAEKILALANERNIPVATVDKGVLNTLSGDRPHQGYVLRCGALEFEPVTRIPLPKPDEPQLWLVLDEVMDPQNLGALLRSVHFLGRTKVLVCAKNSAPPSPTVSAASAGALEVLDVYATSSLPKTLSQAEQDGFRIIGASSTVPRDSEDIDLRDLQDLPALTGPTLLVLGSEGHGLRQLVSKCCTEFVRIPGGNDAGYVDSLNVSVTGGILLWHLLQSNYKNKSA